MPRNAKAEVIASLPGCDASLCYCQASDCVDDVADASDMAKQKASGNQPTGEHDQRIWGR
jgi:hypothetical protein